MLQHKTAMGFGSECMRRTSTRALHGGRPLGRFNGRSCRPFCSAATSSTSASSSSSSSSLSPGSPASMTRASTSPILFPSHLQIPKEAFLQPRTEITTLSNGVRVASQGTFDESATLGIWIDAGSRYETAESNGAAHFLEHMIFKGTQKRSRVQLEKEIEDIGGHLNAYTSREQTVFYSKVIKKDAKQALEILADIILNSSLEQRAIEEEKGVILREMEEVDKNMEEVIFDYLHKSAFRDGPLSYPILGPEDNIKNMTKSHLKDYITTNYKAERIVVAASGDIPHKDIVEWSEKLFGNIPSSPSDLVRPVGEKPYFVGSQLLNKNDDMGPTAHLAVAWEGVSWRSPDSIAFMLMQNIIGGYNKEDDLTGGTIVPAKVSGNSTLFRIANKQAGQSCANAYSAFNTHYKDTGLFGFYVECDEVAVDHALNELIWGNIQMAYSITEEEVHRAKLSLLTQLLGSLDNTTAIAEEIGRHLLVYGRRIPQAELVARILAIDAEEVKRVAWKYLHDQEINMVGIGPLFGARDYMQYRQQTHWWRY